MVKLKSFQVSTDTIMCDIYPEDSIEKGHVEIDKHTRSIVSSSLPKGYDWCLSHIAHAAFYLMDNIGKTEFPNEKIIMWC